MQNVWEAIMDIGGVAKCELSEIQRKLIAESVAELKARPSKEHQADEPWKPRERFRPSKTSRVVQNSWICNRA